MGSRRGFAFRVMISSTSFKLLTKVLPVVFLQISWIIEQEPLVRMVICSSPALFYSLHWRLQLRSLWSPVTCHDGATKLMSTCVCLHRCKPGFYNLREANPEGCRPCFCFGHSLACSSSSHHVVTNITSDFMEGKTRQASSSPHGELHRIHL